jgi:hypothetical protein
MPMTTKETLTASTASGQYDTATAVWAVSMNVGISE